MRQHLSLTWIDPVVNAGVTSEEALLDPANPVHPDLYTSSLPDLLQIKSELVSAS